MAVQSRRVKLIADCLLGVAERFYRRISICGATLRYWRKRVRVERTIDTARRQSPVLKICSPTSLLCGLSNLASRYVVLFGLDCAARQANMQPTMQPDTGVFLAPPAHMRLAFFILCHRKLKLI